MSRLSLARCFFGAGVVTLLASVSVLPGIGAPACLGRGAGEGPAGAAIRGDEGPFPDGTLFRSCRWGGVQSCSCVRRRSRQGASAGVAVTCHHEFVHAGEWFGWE